MRARLLMLATALCLASCASEPYLRMMMDNGDAIYCQPQRGDGTVNCDSDEDYHPLPSQNDTASVKSGDQKEPLPLLRVMVSRQPTYFHDANAVAPDSVTVSASH